LLLRRPRPDDGPVPEFVPALELNAQFYAEVVGPLLKGIPHAAARIGGGSEVLGYDSDRSTDHDWGPAVQVFTTEVEAARSAVAGALPETFRGWPTRYGSDQHVPDTRVSVCTWGEWLSGEFGFDPRGGMSPLDWLLVPQQRLLGVTRGRVYADPDGELAAVRRQLAAFPDQVWLWLLACQWRRISQVEAFVGRTAEVGDELGSRVLAGYVVRELMRLAFLLERTYWPYQKWFGTAFARLESAGALTPLLESAVVATDYAGREAALVGAYELLARTHNATGATKPVDPNARLYFTRPFQVLMSDRFTDACVAELTDPALRRLPLVGSVDQFADSTDLAADAQRAIRLRSLYSES
jgi:hypothetical protein